MCIRDRDVNYADPKAAMRQIAEQFPDQMLWGTDAPYYSYIKKLPAVNGVTMDEVWRSSCRTEGAILNALPPSLIRKISFDNTVKFLFGAGE